MPNSLDVDVDVDWLYKGRKKHKPKKNSVSKPPTSPVLKPAVSRDSTTQAASVQVPLAQTSDSSLGQGSNIVTPKKSEPTENETHHQSTSTRSRSSSLVGKVQPVSASQPLKRSSSLGEKPKKSLFSSLFGKKSASSASEKPTAPLPTPPSHTAKPRSISQPNGPVAARAVPTTPANLTTFLKEPSSPEVKDTAPIHDLPPHQRVVLNKNPNRKTIPIQELSDLSLKRVTFAVDKFGMDPPQQIPSRKPRRGNVLVPDDMLSDIPSISIGITNTQGASGNKQSSEYNKDSKEYKFALDNYKKALKESKKHQQEAHYAAQRIAHEVSSFKARSTAPASGNTAPSTATTGATATATATSATSATHTMSTAEEEKVRNLEIDKPIHMHENHFQNDAIETDDSDLTLDMIYTRCCHLREILPIPSTLRQVKNKTAPLQTLKFLNPRPTLIDILSFCDFIAIVPIHTVVFDNVSLTPEMFKIVISSLVASSTLEKLSLRNVVIDLEGWKLLCKFLVRNPSIVKLDISQTKIKTDLDESLHRGNMDWPLFIDVLQQRHGKPLEELLLNGVKFHSLEHFSNLLAVFGAQGGRKKLGVAQSELTADHLKILLPWMSMNKVQGVDISFNSMDDPILIKILVSKLTSLDFTNLQYFTLNSTNLHSAYDAALLLRSLSKLPNLYFLDLSNLPKIFPEIFPYLNKYLPRFPNLKRLHLDSNEFTFRDLSMISTILPKCQELLHLSMLNQPEESFTKGSSATVYDFVRNSKKLTNLDINYEYIPEDISSRIALCLMRNTQRSMDENFELDEMTSQDDLLFDGSLITETAENVLEKLNSADSLETDATKRYLLKKYWEKINKVHGKVQKTVDDMFDKRTEQELSLQGKENLLRLLFLENTLSNILEILSSIPQVTGVVGVSSSASTDVSDDSGNFELRHIDSERLLSRIGAQDSDVATEEGTAQTKPHIMATDSGRTIDLTTGRPILLKNSSQTSIVGKRQEEEEGEFHKWGFFVQQQRSLYPDHQSNRIPQASRMLSTPPSTREQQQQQQRHQRHHQQQQQQLKQPIHSAVTRAISSAPTPLTSSTPPASRLIAKIPSGAELREAVMKAKGIDSMEELIDKVNINPIKLDNIYGLPLSSVSKSVGSEPAVVSLPNTSSAAVPVSDPTTSPVQKDSKPIRHTVRSIPAMTSADGGSKEFSSEGEDEDKVDETYDKLLNNLSRVRSNK